MIWLLIPPTPPLLPSVSWTGDAKEDWEGEGVGEEPYHTTIKKGIGSKSYKLPHI
jgi:hypothetical protein